MPLKLIIRCTMCGDEIDEWELSDEDPATHVCEIAGDLRLDHECQEKKLPDENPRQKGDDDGVEYGDPRDHRDGIE